MIVTRPDESVGGNFSIAPQPLLPAVPFHGRQPATEDVDQIRAPLLIHYGELNARVNAGWPAYKAALDAAGREYSADTTAGANHGFHNDTTPRYDKEAAELAWRRTIEFFRHNMV